MRIAHAVHAQGGTVALSARNRDDLARAVQGFGSDGCEVHAVVADVCSPEGRQRFGGIDILVNSVAAPADQIVNRPLAEFDGESPRNELETKAFRICGRSSLRPRRS